MKDLQAVDILAYLERVSGGDEELRDYNRALINRWVSRGDGVAVYENLDLSHYELGKAQLVSFGSGESMLPGPVPPVQMPDIGNAINWRYRLVGVYVGEGRV